MNTNLGVSTNTYHGFSLEEALKGISKAGFSYVELTAVKDYTEHVDWQMSAQEINTVKKMLNNFKLTPFALSCHSNLMEDEGVENILKNIELADKLDCNYIVSSTGEAHGDEDEIEDEKILVTNLIKIAKKCNKHGIKIVLETHGNNYGSGEVMYNLVNKVDSNYVGIAYDTANVIFYGDAKPEEDIKKVKDKLYHLHLKDKLGERKEWNFPSIGSGYIDFEAIFDILEKQNYQGGISVEVEFTEEGPESLMEVNQAVEDSYDYINNLI